MLYIGVQILPQTNLFNRDLVVYIFWFIRGTDLSRILYIGVQKIPKQTYLTWI